MIYQWKLRHLYAPYDIIQKGEVEANSEHEAITKLNEKMNIQPHEGELLDVENPNEPSSPGTGDTILT